MEDTSTEVQVVEERTPATLIEEAVAKGANLEDLGKLLELQLKWEENESRKAYNSRCGVQVRLARYL